MVVLAVRREREWRIKFQRYLSGEPGWAIYRRRTRLWKKPTLEEALDYVRRHDGDPIPWGSRSR